MADKRAYLWLLLVVVAMALALTAVARAPGHRAPEPSRIASPAHTSAMTLEIRDGVLSPSVTQARKGERITLHVVNGGSTACTLALLGYGDRLPPIALRPGARWDGTLAADLPGDDFAWMLNGTPAGRFEVTGSHLVEGHR